MPGIENEWLRSRSPATSTYRVGMARVVEIVAKVLAASLAVALVLYLAINAVGWVQARGTRGDINKELTATLAEVVPTEKVALARLAESDPRPELSWIEQDCDFPTSDAGWMVQAYSQRCTLITMTAWPVADQQAAARLADSLPVELAGAPAEDSGLPRCVTLRAEGARLGLGDRRESTFVAPQDDTDYGCGNYYGPRFRARTLAGESSDLDPTRAWLVVRHEQELGQWTLGCLHWSILFCDNPFGGKPAHGEPPQ